MIQPFFFPDDKHIGMDRELNNREIGEGLVHNR